MRQLSLRRYDPKERNDERLLALWGSAGNELKAASLCSATQYLHFEAEALQGRWRGLLEPREWLAAAVPGLAGYAPQGVTNERIVELFAASPQPLDLPFNELAIKRVISCEIQRGADYGVKKLPSIQTPFGQLWLSALPEIFTPMNNSLEHRLTKLSFPISVVLGYTDVSMPILRRLAKGGVLLLADKAQYFIMAGRRLGHFDLTGEGIQVHTLEKTHEKNRLNPVVDLGHLPVRLEFVLQESVLDLSELKALNEGGILPLVPGAERSVELRANGLRLARGELVQLDGSLGVELMELFIEGNEHVE
ncbi:Type III secretion inner membrane protein (YscQ) [Pseudomonas sp. R2-37-08W]|uniref:FliM/FliN family flagellar motor switch protein n=1 Tax=unclassified Pseudomonas TaxID=196821 RepID=UPI000F582B2E|nr:MULTISPECIES: FliM/FliN family flagellar motor switch protein [unclassified Pseudomonas]AZF10355.1 Type III secretion inner membrane protein (YscQ) [Pseudomonas sp. R2-37-08W]AZF20888.1 Type III secretion inner membrane protein (YscQ) [Pseudomonas sp. R3-52-08]MDQ0741112.1 type III secretion protein Q [Pseudomonas sp. W4I3]